MKLKLAAVIFLLSMLNGCVLMTVGTVAVAGAAVHRNDRTTGTIIDDNIIVAKIKNKYRRNFKELFARVSVKSIDRRVLLTGQVRAPEYKIEAVKLSWEVNGVQEVINELEIQPNPTSSITRYSKDSVITAHAKSRILLQKSVKSINYNIETVNGVVYVMGIGQSEEERDIVLDSISRVQGVQKVISYVRIKN